jgi:hypothetical protein
MMAPTPELVQFLLNQSTGAFERPIRGGSGEMPTADRVLNHGTTKLSQASRGCCSGSFDQGEICDGYR